MILEICANGFESAQIAQDTGAHRIELCENLSVGGLTPSYDLIERVIRELDVETHVLIRPREGDFCYTDAELQQMEKDIFFCKEIGCAGVVTGVLTSEGDLNRKATQHLLEAAQGLEFTFHRAIDVAREPQQLLRETILMGVTRILSSGTEATAEKGLTYLMEFHEIAQGYIQIMPGGGITPTNAWKFRKAGFEMIHTSATQKTDQSKGDFFTSGAVGTSDPALIRKILEEIQ
ncbi:copper homeostasis protein CutC [Aureisphaera galaxeae]|uniref:copper homeostasis protein CutC n=1 Tax=Aureisphaera galaxeae TaxID=1538023 RepID=UPI00234FDFB0|nr:copper homeostasis protein CutC [Aureisphaera galaxeae]MDC8005258.1 copper homeostasis protein CutC [Aureisphaera galaxeae]